MDKRTGKTGGISIISAWRSEIKARIWRKRVARRYGRVAYESSSPFLRARMYNPVVPPPPPLLYTLRRKTASGWAYYLKRFCIYLFINLAVVIGYFIAVDNNLLLLFGSSPGMAALENPKVAQASEVFTFDRKSIGKYYTANRMPTIFKNINHKMVDALVATEDVRFYEHSGIDFPALPAMLVYKLRGDNRGGSTITQQLAKNMYRTRESESSGLLGNIPLLNTLIAKSKEWITAIKLERRFSKEEIITMYLNTVDFGSNSFGIRTAARTYFNTTPDSLNLQQAATLTGMLKAVTTYNPKLNPRNSLARRNVVLGQMLKYKKIQAPEYEKAVAEPIALDFHVENHADGPATYFRSVLNNVVKEWCRRHNYDLYTDGLKIYTTIDSKWQRHAEEAVAEHMRSLQKIFDNHWGNKDPWVDEKGKEITWYIDSAAMRLDYYKYLYKQFNGNKDKVFEVLRRPKRMRVFYWNPDRKPLPDGSMPPNEKEVEWSSLDSLKYYKKLLRVGFMAMDHENGQIKAWVGGVDYKYFKFDHVMQSKRQPGSTFKPILYAAAFEKGDAAHPGGYGPCDTMQDRPVTIRYIERGQEKSWSPKNADYVFSGQWRTLRNAMARSINSIAAQLTQRIGWVNVIEQARRMGIESRLDTVPSVSLGTGDVNVFEMTGAYGSIMNRGMWIEPNFILRIEDRNGKVIYEPKPRRRRALSEENAWLMSYMLAGGTEEPGGTSQALFQRQIFSNNTIGGKTGTSSNHSDGWFMGATRDLVAGTWVGGEDRAIHFRTSAMGEGSKTALPVFGLFMEKMYADKSTGIVHAYFPKSTVVIDKPHNCRTAWTARKPENDSLENNSGRDSM